MVSLPGPRPRAGAQAGVGVGGRGGDGQQPRGRVSYHGLLAHEVDVLRRTEVGRQRQAVEVRAQLAVVDGEHVEEQHEAGEEEERRQQAHPHQQDLLVAVVAAERHERHQGVRQQEAEDEAEEVCVVVHPWQQAERKERQRDGEQLAECLIGMTQHGPRIQHLHDEARQQTELGTRWAHVGAVRYEDGAGQISGHATADVDDADPQAAGELLQVTHQEVLDEERDHQLQDPGV